jgi:hypothetical protein
MIPHVEERVLKCYLFLLRIDQERFRGGSLESGRCCHALCLTLNACLVVFCCFLIDHQKARKYNSQAPVQREESNHCFTRSLLVRVLLWSNHLQDGRMDEILIFLAGDRCRIVARERSDPVVLA